MTRLTIPRLTSGWRVVAFVMAAFGFAIGYSMAVGGPLCGSLGGCLGFAARRGLAGVTPAALASGVIVAVVFAAFVYLLFLFFYGIRKARHRPPAARVDQEPPAVQVGPRRWSRPTPLAIAIGAALAWGFISVGPTNLGYDLDLLPSKDAVTAPSVDCPSQQYILKGTRCTYSRTLAQLYGLDPVVVLPDTDAAVMCRSGALEADGMCHERSVGTVRPLMDDVLQGGQSGLLAFLAVGAALLLWPRLRAAGQPTD